MDGRNSLGRRVSLLNDADQPVVPVKSSSAITTLTRLPYRALTRSPLTIQSSLNSAASSPKTPLLTRSESSDSVAMQTPSPLTPNFTFDGVSPAPQSLATPFAETAFFGTDAKDPLSVYPAVPEAAGPLLYPSATIDDAATTAEQAPAYYRSNSTTTQRSTGNPKSKKNHYPCPLAKQYSCPDHFTTSGHAARHAKKHTGKKDAHCPECNKAFTRKDNMEQHRRTHQTGRNAKSGSDESRVKKAKQQPQAQSQPQREPTKVVVRPGISPLQSSSITSSVLGSYVDPSVPISPMSAASGFGMSPSLSSAEVFIGDYMRSSYPDPTQFAHPHLTSGYEVLSPSYALDALAMAASGEKRKFDGCT